MCKDIFKTIVTPIIPYRKKSYNEILAQDTLKPCYILSKIMLPYILNVYVTVKFSPKVYRNVTHARWKLLVSRCGSSCLMEVCGSLALFVHHWCAGPDVVRNVGESRWLFGSECRGTSGNVGELAGCWVQDPTATKYMLQPRVNLPLGYLHHL